MRAPPSGPGVPLFLPGRRAAVTPGDLRRLLARQAIEDLLGLPGEILRGRLEQLHERSHGFLLTASDQTLSGTETHPRVGILQRRSHGSAVSLVLRPAKHIGGGAAPR